MLDAASQNLVLVFGDLQVAVYDVHEVLQLIMPFLEGACLLPVLGVVLDVRFSCHEMPL